MTTDSITTSHLVPRRPFDPGSARRHRNGIVALVTVLLAISTAFPASRAAGQGSGDRTVRLATISELPSSQKRWALVIGIDEYTDEQLTPLRGAANDFKTLAAALVAHAGFPADQVVVLASDQPASRRPTRGNILQRLSNLQSVVPKDGLLVVSFSGHGIERGGKAYLLPEDARAANDVGLLEDTAISVDRMRERIRATGVGQVMVLLDACRNDPVSGRADSTNALSRAYTRGFNFDVANREVQAFATLYATGVGDRAYEYAERRQGYFTWAVVDGLAGAAANPDGRVTLAGLVRYVQTAVPKRIGVDLGAGKRQRPFATIEGYRADELVLAVAASPAPVAAAPAPVVVDPKAVEVELWSAIKDSRDAADYEDYLKQYPSGSYAGVARAKIKKLRAAAPVELGPVRPAPAGGSSSQPAAARPAGDTIVDLGGGVRIELVVVPAGSFDMGSTDGGPYSKPVHDYDNIVGDLVGEESTGIYDERPVRRVTISQPFLMGKYEVTQGQWKAVMGSNPSKVTGNDELPVDQVSWDDLQGFIRRLNSRTRIRFRLPTEAEWEYACRAGSTGDFAGDLVSMGWYSSNSNNQAHLVGAAEPNRWGLYDMHGNVWEWCADWYDESYQSQRPATDPAGPTLGSLRVIRGGGWYSTAVCCRSAFRSRASPDTRNVTLGFRLVRIP